MANYLRFVTSCDRARTPAETTVYRRGEHFQDGMSSEWTSSEESRAECRSPERDGLEQIGDCGAKRVGEATRSERSGQLSGKQGISPNLSGLPGGERRYERLVALSVFSAGVASNFLAVTREPTTRFDGDQEGGTSPYESGQKRFPVLKRETGKASEEDSDMSQGPGKAESCDLQFGLSSGLEHDASDQTNRDQVSHEFLLEGAGSLTVPMSGSCKVCLKSR